MNYNLQYHIYSLELFIVAAEKSSFALENFINMMDVCLIFRQSTGRPMGLIKTGIGIHISSYDGVMGLVLGESKLF